MEHLRRCSDAPTRSTVSTTEIRLVRYRILIFGGASDIVGPILEDIPADPTNLEDMVHAELFHGRPEKALEYAAQLDPWLSSHLADLMNALSLIDSETDNE